MRPILSCEEVRNLEDIIEKEGTTKAELMELAGEFAAAQVERLSPKTVLVLAGFGNNGGDGWVAADILSQKGIKVTVVSPVEPDEVPSTLARHVARRTAGRDVTVFVGPSRDELSALIAKADVVLDAILGTGFSGNLRPPFNIWIDALNDAAATVVAVDVPSGLNAQTGEVSDVAVRADVTATMLAPKLGLFSADGPEYAGELICGELYDKLDEVINDVEHAAETVEASDLIDYMGPLPSGANKYSRGSVLVVAGSATYPGAPGLWHARGLARRLWCRRAHAGGGACRALRLRSLRAGYDHGCGLHGCGHEPSCPRQAARARR